MTIGERIKNRRIELGLSQEELAQRLGNKSRASVCTVEKNKEDLTTDRIRKYAIALETTPAYLMGWEEQDGLITVDLNDAPVPTQAEIDKAMNLYKKMKSLPPEMQTALLNLLEVAQTDT